MANETTGEPSFSAEEQASFKEYWEFYTSQRPSISAYAREEIKKVPELAALMAGMSPEQLEKQEAQSQELQRAALVDGRWGHWLERQRALGATYAQAGLSFGAWFQVLRIYREGVRRELQSANLDAAKLLRISHAMDRFVDLGMEIIGVAYLDTKERTIQSQQAAIRELSTPVLQVREKLLIIPIVGMVDTQRARHLTQSLLDAIRQRRARLVVMDITGVPVVDSKVANHLVQACEAARLMGTRVILSGVSPEIAQALVTLGADLPGVATVVDLQSALEDGDRWLAGGALAGAEEPAPEVAARP
ncbi:MAG TPA: STAS domain-containing protein [Myxococcales bacterium]|nr:STAS domain-containing protein [Myxococcales bacterium]